MEKKPRAKRRDFAAELRVLRLHAEISLEVLEEMAAAEAASPVLPNMQSDYRAGQIATLKAMLGRMKP